MSIPLITLAEIRQFRNVSNLFNADDLQSRILTVQNSNLLELLGNSLYTDLFDNLIEQKYIDLINGQKYINNSNETITYFGLKPFLAWHFLAGLMVDNSLKLNDLGNVQMTGNNFDISGGDNEKVARGVYLTNAQRSYNDIVEFLDNNSSYYPLWEVKKEESLSSFDISFI